MKQGRGISIKERLCFGEIISIPTGALGSFGHIYLRKSRVCESRVLMKNLQGDLSQPQFYYQAPDGYLILCFSRNNTTSHLHMWSFMNKSDSHRDGVEVFGLGLVCDFPGCHQDYQNTYI